MRCTSDRCRRCDAGRAHRHRRSASPGHWRGERHRLGDRPSARRGAVPQLAAAVAAATRHQPEGRPGHVPGSGRADDSSGQGSIVAIASTAGLRADPLFGYSYGVEIRDHEYRPAGRTRIRAGRIDPPGDFCEGQADLPVDPPPAADLLADLLQGVQRTRSAVAPPGQPRQDDPWRVWCAACPGHRETSRPPAAGRRSALT